MLETWGIYFGQIQGHLSCSHVWYVENVESFHDWLIFMGRTWRE